MNTTFVAYMQRYADKLLHRPSLMAMFTHTVLPTVTVTGSIKAGQPLDSVVGFNRAQILAALQPYAAYGLVIGGGAAMVLHGYRYVTNDLDVSATPEMFHKLVSTFKVNVVKAPSGSDMITLPGTKIDVFIEPGMDTLKTVVIDGHKVEDLDTLLKFYKSFNRPKDQYWISRLSSTGMPRLDGTIHAVVDNKNTRVGYAYVHNNTLIGVVPSEQEPTIPFDLYEEIELKRGDIGNWTSAPGVSTIGRYVLNWMLLASIFENHIDYVNENWNIDKIEKLIAKGLMNNTFNMTQYNKYIDHGYFLGHSAEICVPTITRKSFTTDPQIAIRKKELLEKYKGQLEDPLIIAKIEDELLAMDKAWIKDDDAYGFHQGIGGKSFDIHRKKMHIAVGGIEEFDTEGGTFNFLQNSLTEGWRKEDFPVIANEIRKGSYSRGKETAKGGAMTKFILRVFQDVRITEEDCGTKEGLTAVYAKHVLAALVGRTVYVDGKEMVVTVETIPVLLTKEVTLRSPTHCKTKNGLCYKCCGNNFKALGVEAIGPQAVEISSRFMLTSMKLIA